MSKKATAPDRKKSVDKFVGSTGDESYLQDKDSKQVANATFLSELASGVRKDLATSAGNLLAAGDKLREVRKLIGSDQKYGKWCKAEFPMLKTRFLHKVRALADDPKLRDGVKGKSPLALSVAFELLGAPEDVKDEVLASDPPMSRQQVREAKATAKAPESAAEFEESIGGRPPAADQSSVSDEELDRVDRETQEHMDAEAEARANAPVMESRTVVMRGAIQLMVHERIDAYLGYGAGMDTGWAFFIFGVMATWEDDADAPNRAELEARYKGFAKVCHPDTGGNSDRMAALNDARQEVINYYID